MKPLFIGIALLWATAAAAAGVQLEADVFDVELDSGVMALRGNVRISDENLTLRAPRGTAWRSQQKINLQGGVTVKGTWQGKNLDLSAYQLTAFVGDKASFEALGEVKATFGTLTFESGTFAADQGTFTAREVKKLIDRAQGFELSAQKLMGAWKDGQLSTLTAQGDARAERTEGEAMVLTARQISYDASKGLLTAQGDALATNGTRTLRAERVIYDSKAGKVRTSGRSSATFPDVRNGQ